MPFFAFASNILPLFSCLTHKNTKKAQMPWYVVKVNKFIADWTPPKLHFHLFSTSNRFPPTYNCWNTIIFSQILSVKTPITKLIPIPVY